MGGGRWTDKDWKRYSRATVDGKDTDHIYTSRSMAADLSPKDVLRESRDSADNPESNAIILALDDTGSMGMVLDAMMRGMNTLVTEIYERKPVPDPHIMCMGVGDVEYDRAPLQVTQFEADIRVAEQLQKIYLERGGGGNSYESYTLAWYFAAMCTSIDCFEKRGKKGYLFTVGDENPTILLRKEHIAEVLGASRAPQTDLTPEQILELVSRTYHVFHVVVEEGHYCRSSDGEPLKAWSGLLGQRMIKLSDHTKLPEVVVSAIQINEGAVKSEVIESWKDSSTSVAVARAVKSMIPGEANKAGTGLVRF